MAREDELFRKLNNGDASALDELIRIYYPEILRYCSWHTSDRQTAEDATQETFLKAVRHLDNYIHHGKFRAFLYKIAVNTCADLWRKGGTEAHTESESYTERGFMRVESEQSFSKMLDALPENQREIVLLRFEQELKIREIANILGLPLRTVQSRLRSALKTLKGALQDE